MCIYWPNTFKIITISRATCPSSSFNLAGSFFFFFTQFTIFHIKRKMINEFAIRFLNRIANSHVNRFYHTHTHIFGMLLHRWSLPTNPNTYFNLHFQFYFQFLIYGFLSYRIRFDLSKCWDQRTTQLPKFCILLSACSQSRADGLCRGWNGCFSVVGAVCKQTKFS